MTRVKVVGLGNVLMGDDGFGPWAVRVLDATWKVPRGVSLEDLGTPGFDLVPHFSHIDALVVLDTVNARGRPGEVRTYGREAILGAPSGPRVNPHEATLTEALLALEFAGEAPPSVMLVGVIPDTVSRGTALSAAVRAAFPAVERAVAGELARLGVPPVRRAEPKEPRLWWRRAPCTS